MGTDAAVWHRRPSTGWQSMGGSARVDLVAYAFDGSTYVFGVGIDKAVWYRQLKTACFRRGMSPGGQILSDPAVTTDGTDLDVAGNDDALWTRRLTSSGWLPWQSVGGRERGALGGAL